MKLLKEIFCEPGLNLQGMTIFREAVRGIICHQGKFLLIHSQVSGDYKFPGGGVNLSETFFETLTREVREECGAYVSEVVSDFGKVIEFDTPCDEDFDLFKMVSYYYVCRVDTNKPLMPLNLDDYEKKLQMHPEWIDIHTALETNQEILASGRRLKPRWMKREVYVMSLIQEMIEQGSIHQIASLCDCFQSQSA